MAFVFDHLIAILVGATLLGALLFVQLRQQQQTIETTQRDNVQMQAADFLHTLQRDVENIRTRAQTEAALGGYRLTLRRKTGIDGESYTEQFSFPTLKDPALGAASPVVLVTYQLTPTDRSVRVGAATRPIYRATRHVYSRADGATTTGGAENLVDLDVMLVRSDGVEISTGGEAYGENDEIGRGSGANGTPLRAKIAAVAAAETGSQRTHDQRSTSAPAVTRHAETVRILGATARQGLPTPETGTPGIPPLPGDPPAPPPPAPAPPAPEAPRPTTTPSRPRTTSRPTTPSRPAPAPTPRPSPPAGAEI